MYPEVFEYGGHQYRLSSLFLEYSNSNSSNNNTNNPYFIIGETKLIYGYRFLNFRGDKTFYTTFRKTDLTAAQFSNGVLRVNLPVTAAGYDNFESFQNNLDLSTGDGWLEKFQTVDSSISLVVGTDEAGTSYSFKYPDFIDGVSPINLFEYIFNKDTLYLSFFSDSQTNYTFTVNNYDVRDAIGGGLSLPDTYTTQYSPVYYSYLSSGASGGNTITFSTMPTSVANAIDALSGAKLYEYTEGRGPLLNKIYVKGTGFTWDAATKTATFTSTVENGSVYVFQSSSGTYLNYVIFPNSPNITGPSYLYLRSNNLSKGQQRILTGQGIGKAVNIVGKLPVNNAYLTAIEWDNPDQTYVTLDGISTVSAIDLFFTSFNYERNLPDNTYIDWRGGIWSVGIELVVAERI